MTLPRFRSEATLRATMNNPTGGFLKLQPPELLVFYEE